MKYYIRMTNHQTGKVKYKRYKCIDGFSENKAMCWQFSKPGALKIIERLKQEYRMKIDHITFDIEEAEQ